jgi:5-methylcytosine-specific restriction endonuclease McrA
MSVNSERVKKWAKTHPEKHREQVRKWEKENPEKHREITRRSHAKRLIEVRQQAIACLGGMCTHCQCKDIRCLQIDHIVPLQGKERIGTMVLYRSVVRGLKENLQVLCANCHAIKTYYENGGK